jgi:hypothetical protein
LAGINGSGFGQLVLLICKWVQSTDAKVAELSDEDILANSQAYLVNASGDGDNTLKLIKKNFKVIFEEELAGGTRMKKYGPRKWICGYLSSGFM